MLMCHLKQTSVKSALKPFNNNKDERFRPRDTEFNKIRQQLS